jgi:hypothetical protein
VYRHEASDTTNVDVLVDFEFDEGWKLPPGDSSTAIRFNIETYVAGCAGEN